MSGLIPIPEADTYGITLLVVFSLASFSLSAHLYSRWLAARGRSFIAVHCAVLAAIGVWGLLILGPEGIVSRSPIAWTLAIPVGIGCGIFAMWSDRAIVRGLSRRRLLRNPRQRPSPAPRTGRYSETRAVTRMTPVAPGARVVQGARGQPRRERFLRAARGLAPDQPRVGPVGRGARRTRLPRIHRAGEPAVATSRTRRGGDPRVGRHVRAVTPQLRVGACSRQVAARHRRRGQRHRPRHSRAGDHRSRPVQLPDLARLSAAAATRESDVS